MIGKLKGLLETIGESEIILDVNGVGYVVAASARTLRNLPGVGQAVVLHIETQMREDSIRLFGFLTEAEVRRVFQQIVDHFPRGEIVFNIVSSLVKNQRERRPVPLFTKFGITENWVLDDMRGAEEFDHRLHYVDGQSQVEAPLLAHAPLYYRALCGRGCELLSVSAFGSNQNASKEVGEPNHAGDAGGKSVWWSWTAPSAYPC